MTSRIETNQYGSYLAAVDDRGADLTVAPTAGDRLRISVYSPVGEDLPAQQVLSIYLDEPDEDRLYGYLRQRSWARRQARVEQLYADSGKAEELRRRRQLVENVAAVSAAANTAANAAHSPHVHGCKLDPGHPGGCLSDRPHQFGPDGCQHCIEEGR